MKLTEYIAKKLRLLNIDTIFTVPAESILYILRALRDEGINIVTAKFEPSAGFMGLVYSRITSKPGIVIVTAGPGAFGTLLPLGQALVEGDPLIIIATVALSERGTAMHQLPNADSQFQVFRPLTKASFRVSKVNEIRDVINKAFSVALSGKPGPVYIEIVPEVLEEEYSMEDEQLLIEINKPQAHSSEVKKVADLLSEAERPVIIAGRGVYLSGAKEELLKVAELLSAPIATTIMAKGLISPDHKLFAGVAAGKAGNLVAHEIIRTADVVLAIGNRFSEIGTGRYSLEIRGELIHVNVDPIDLGRAYRPTIAVLADAKDFLTKLLIELSKREIKSKEYLIKELRELWRLENEDLEKYYENAWGPIKSWEVIKAIRKVLKRKNNIFIGDVGAHRIESFLMPIYEGELYITTTSYVSMGLAVPGSVASSFVYPDRDTIALVGDGGFLMTGLEVATAVEYRLNPKIVVFNDSAYRVLGIYEKRRYRNVTEKLFKLSYVDFAKLSESLGAKGIKIRERSELESVLEESFNSREPVVVDIIIDPYAVPIPFQRLYGMSSLH